jgi:hypothetical protein
VERWVAENGEEFESEAGCQSYEEFLTYSPPFVELLKGIAGDPSVKLDAGYILDYLWDEGYKLVKRDQNDNFPA